MTIEELRASLPNGGKSHFEGPLPGQNRFGGGFGIPAAGGGGQYGALLASDPVFAQAMQAIEARNAQQQAQVAAARQQALIGYGAIPDQLGGLAGDVTDNTRRLADQATESGVSTTAQLKRGYRRQQGQSTANLGARGMLRSGGYKQHSRENTQDYQVAQTGALQNLLAGLGGINQNNLDFQQQQAQSATAASSDALARIMGGINTGVYPGGGGGGTTLPPSLSPPWIRRSVMGGPSAGPAAPPKPKRPASGFFLNSPGIGRSLY